MVEHMNKVFFTPGDRVTIKHEIPNKPTMLVRGKETTLVKKEGEASYFKGIKCFWFTLDNLYQEQIFSTKDLIHI